MDTDTTIARFWHTYALAQKAPTHLLENTLPFSSGPLAEVVYDVDIPSDIMPEESAGMHRQ